MIKKLHYIKEDYSSNIENSCVTSLKVTYPDFEFHAWRPNSSPLRILYDNGGLFVGPGLYSSSRIPDSYFDKSFFAFDNSFGSKRISQNICYANSEKEPLFLTLMEKGFDRYFIENCPLPFRQYQNEFDYSFDDVALLNKNKFGGFDKLSKTLYKNPYLLDTNTNHMALNGWNLHYTIINENTIPDKLYGICDSFIKMKVEDGSKHFMLLVFNNGDYDLYNKIAEFMVYQYFGENKGWNVIIAPDGKVENYLIEYIGRRFNELVSCEKVI